MRALFIGNFLARSMGSQPVSERVAERLRKEGIEVVLVSRIRNRVFRLVDIVLNCFFGRYTVLHIDVFSGNSFLFARIAGFIGKARKKKIILTLHGGALHEYYVGREAGFKVLFDRCVVQSPSNFLKAFFESKGFNVFYCPNPVDLEMFPFSRTDVKPSSLLWVRAFTKIYNPLAAVRVVDLLVKEFPDLALTMVGPDLGFRAETEELIRQLKLTDRITIVGPVPNDSLWRYYQSHAVYLNTTSYESFGVALVEAAACGVPLVSYKVGEVPFVWESGESILLCEVGDNKQMADQVRRVLVDEQLNRMLSINARKKAESFAWETVRDHWIKLLKTG